jgi:hypothetical protein
MKAKAEGIAIELAEDCIIHGREFCAGETCYLRARDGVDVQDWIDLHVYILDHDGVFSYGADLDAIEDAFLPTW